MQGHTSKKPPTYIVTGMMRSGTSMMMQCLTAGGLEPLVDPKRENMNNRYGDDYYKPNKKGFYEASFSEYQDLLFPSAHTGYLIKALRGGLTSLYPLEGGYHFVFMTRDPEEIRQSYEAFFGYPCNDKHLLQYDSYIQWGESHLRNRKDVISYLFLDFRFVVENAVQAFQQLVNLGWPIDVNLASQQVDQSQYRFRRELLVEGI